MTPRCMGQAQVKCWLASLTLHRTTLIMPSVLLLPLPMRWDTTLAWITIQLAAVLPVRRMEAASWLLQLGESDLQGLTGKYRGLGGGRARNAEWRWVCCLMFFTVIKSSFPIFCPERLSQALISEFVLPPVSYQEIHHSKASSAHTHASFSKTWTVWLLTASSKKWGVTRTCHGVSPWHVDFYGGFIAVLHMKCINSWQGF